MHNVRAFVVCCLAYHCQCIDKWLTSRSRACPVCKTKVRRRGGSESSDSDDTLPTRPPRAQSPRNGATASIAAAAEDDESEENQNERAPLVLSLERDGGRYGSSASPRNSEGSSTSVDSVAATAVESESTDRQPSQLSLLSVAANGSHRPPANDESLV